MEGQEYRKSGTGKDRGYVARPGPGHGHGWAMQSRESSLTNSNQRVNMGTCGELASTGTYFFAAPLTQLHCGCVVGRQGAVPESQDMAVFPTA